LEITFFIIASSLIIYILQSVYKQEKSREVELNFHIMQAKRFLNSKDLEDKRSLFIERFKKAEHHLVAAQSFCTKSKELNSINNIRVKLEEIKRKYSN